MSWYSAHCTWSQCGTELPSINSLSRLKVSVQASSRNASETFMKMHKSNQHFNHITMANHIHTNTHARAHTKSHRWITYASLNFTATVCSNVQSVSQSVRLADMLCSRYCTLPIKINSPNDDHKAIKVYLVFVLISMGRTVCLITPFLKLTHTLTLAHIKRERERHTKTPYYIQAHEKRNHRWIQIWISFFYNTKYLKLLLLLLGLTDVFFSSVSSFPSHWFFYVFVLVVFFSHSLVLCLSLFACIHSWSYSHCDTQACIVYYRFFFRRCLIRS